MEENFNVVLTRARENPIDSAIESGFIRKIDIDSKYVSDGLINYFENWQNLYPVVISSQTGSGKNYFIENTLIKNNRHSKILIVSNRTALNRQLKRRICSQLGLDNLLLELTDIGLDVHENFANVSIISYQKLSSYLRTKSKNEFRFDFVIFDEAHFFFSDALFNNEVDLLLDKCITYFEQAIRIYITATPNEILPELSYREHVLSTKNFRGIISNNRNYCNRTLIYYNFKRNFKYIKFKYFDKKADLLNIIEHSSKESKWIIFVPSIKVGDDFKEKLGDDAVFITADSKKNKIYNEIVKEERFSCRILISTSVLDNGINICDPLVKHIVIFSHDESEFLQMLGRRRVQEGDFINLYLFSSSINNATTKLYQVKNQIKLILDCKKNPISFLNQSLSNPNIPKGMLYFDKGGCHVNKLSEKKLYSLKIFLETLINKFKEDGRKAFILTQLSWLGLESTYSEDLWLDFNSNNEAFNAFINFLDENCNKELEGNELTEFQEKFKVLVNAAYGKQNGDRSDRVYKTTKMRSILKSHSLTYKIEESKNVIIICKI